MDPELQAYVERHLTPLALTTDDAIADAASNAHPTSRYSTTGAVDAYYRIRAHVTGRPAATTHYAPAIPPTSPIAVVVSADPDTFHLCTGTTEHELTAADLLAALPDLGATTARETHRTLVVDTPHTLARLTALARQPHVPIPVAATLDWWGQRADHPGTGATRVLARDLNLRWTLATAPGTRVSIQDWHAALNTTTPPAPRSPARSALDLALALAAGHSLSGLLDRYSEDSRSWTWLRKAAGPRWRTHDTLRDAALGLLTRSQAAEHYASLRLGDPAVAAAETRTGTVVETTVTAVDDQRRTVTLSALRPLIRHRVGTRLQGWLGTATTHQQEMPDLYGTLTQILVTAAGTLDITLGEVVRPSRLQPGATLTLRPRHIDPFQQGTFRAMYHQHFGSGRNWLARTTAPSVTRRPVPLDVIVAAADE